MLTPIVLRLRVLLFRRSADAELDEELRYHLDRETERNVARGLDPRAARAAANRTLGNITVVTEQARDAWRWRWVEELRQDVAFAVRTFRRAPMFVLTVVATIGLGLGLLATAFTFFDAYVLRPLAVRDPSSLYEVSWTSRNGVQHQFTWPQYQRLCADRTLLGESFGFRTEQWRLNGRVAIGQLVTGNYFQVLGVPPAIGRTLMPSDATEPGSGAVMVLSDRAWRTTFGGDSAVVGRRVSMNGATFTIVGVAREGFGGLTSVPYDFWIPITMITAIGPVPTLFGPEQPEAIHVIGRFAPGATAAVTRSRFLAWLGGETTDRPPRGRPAGVGLMPRGTSIPRSPAIVAVFAPVIVAFLLVLLIACANVANMMLARGLARQREIGIRLALGAGRGRLIRQLLTEAVLLAVPSGVAGFVVSRAAIGLSIGTMFATVPAGYAQYLRPMPLDADGRVFAFMLSAAVLAAVMFGLAPALQTTRPNIVQASRGDSDTQFRPSRLRNMLVVAQITLSVVLLVCAGVLLSGARHTERLEPGIRTQNVVQIEVMPRLRQRVLDALRAEPTVRAIAGSSSTPLDGMLADVGLIANGKPAERTNYIVVSPEYFGVFDLPIVSGRNFTPDEARARSPVVVVSRSTAGHFWPGKDPIGQTLTMSPSEGEDSRLARYRAAKVIGVTADAVPGWIGRSPAEPTVYYAGALDDSAALQLGRESQILVRVNTDGERARALLERTLASVDSSAVVEMHTLEASLALQVYPFRAMYWVASAVGVIALILTLTGVYGVLSFVVAQRRKEFGIRMALGAAGATLIALVLRQSLRLSIVGIGAGVVIALAVSRLFAGAVFVLNTFDVAGYAGGAMLVLGACLFAAYLPSRRAARVDPVQALRADS